MAEEKVSDKRTFKQPDAFKLDPEKGYMVRDAENSEEFLLFETIGRPRVVYAIKANKYYKDLECEKPYTDTELNAMGLPIPIEIETERRKLIEQANKKGELANLLAIQRSTAPKVLDYPDQFSHLKELADPMARDIARLQRSVLGRKGS